MSIATAILKIIDFVLTEVPVIAIASQLHTVCILNFCGLIFHVFDWQENLWGINFHGNGSSVVGTIIVGFAKYASYYVTIY